MSDRPLLSGAEALARSFHLMIDDVLTFRGSELNESSQKLADLLRFVAGDTDAPPSHEGFLLRSLLRDKNGRLPAGLMDLSNALGSGDLTDEQMAVLDKYAERISEERAALAARSDR
jgi:hypothetical protein